MTSNSISKRKSKLTLGVQLLLVIVTLEINQLTTLIVAFTNKQLSERHYVIFDSFEFLQVQAFLTLFFLTGFLVLSSYALKINTKELKGKDKEITQTEKHWEIIISMLAMSFVAVLAISAGLAKLQLDIIINRHFGKMVLFIILYLIAILLPLLVAFYTESENVTNCLNMYIQTFPFLVILAIIGYTADHYYNMDIVYNPQGYLAFSIMWYIFALTPTRLNFVWTKKYIGTLYIISYLVLGFACGAVYGLYLYSGKEHYNENHNRVLASICWGIYSLVPMLIFLFLSSVRRLSSQQKRILTIGLSMASILLLNFLMSNILENSTANLIHGLIIGIIFGLALCFVEGVYLTLHPNDT